MTDDDLLPGEEGVLAAADAGPQDPGNGDNEDALAEREAVSRLEGLGDEAEPEEGVVPFEAAAAHRRRRNHHRDIPENLGTPVLQSPSHLKLISIGKAVANVTTTLVFTLDLPVNGIRELMGEHAYAVAFGGNYLGEGAIISEAPLKADVENNVIQQVKLKLPRFAEGLDQVETYILPLLPTDGRLDAVLGALAWAWRLNITADLQGDLQLFEPQASLDLTTRAE